MDVSKTVHSGHQLILASASPRRAELLAQLGLDFTVQIADINESPESGETAQAYVCRMAEEKAAAVYAKLSQSHDIQPALSQTGLNLVQNKVILAADTSVVVDGEIIGKPRDKKDGLAILSKLSGRSHEVLTAIAVYAGDELRQALSISEVHFVELSDVERLAYWQTGEGRDKAGCYAVQGLAAQFIAHISGSYSGVMGLPLCETAKLLKLAGITVLSTDYE